MLPRPLRRIHISQATLDCLGGIYETEAGHGQDRSEILRKHNIDTYLIRPKPREASALPKTRRPSYDDMTTWSAELPFGDILGMNFVSTDTKTRLFSAMTFETLTLYCPLWCSVDPRHLHKRLFDPVAQSDRSTAVGLTGSQQEDPSGHGGSEQRANEEGAHHNFHTGVQGLSYGGEGN